MNRRAFLASLAAAASATLLPLGQRVIYVQHRYEEGMRVVRAVVNSVGDVLNPRTGNFLGRMVNGRYVPWWDLP